MNYLGNVGNFYISSIYDIYLVIRVDIYLDTLYEKRLSIQPPGFKTGIRTSSVNTSFHPD